MKIVTENCAEGKVLSFKGRGAVEDTGLVIRKLLEVFHEMNVELNFTGITDCDFPFLKVLDSFLNCYSTSKKNSLSIIISPENPLWRIWQEYGLDYNFLRRFIAGRKN